MNSGSNTLGFLLAVLFFVPCGWLIVDIMFEMPKLPSPWPLIPMVIAAVWFFVVRKRI